MSTSKKCEWRVCGRSSRRGDWIAGWRTDDLDSRAWYDIQQYANRNDEVWIERRTVEVLITEQSRTPVPPTYPTSQHLDDDPERSMQEGLVDP